MWGIIGLVLFLIACTFGLKGIIIALVLGVIGFISFIIYSVTHPSEPSKGGKDIDYNWLSSSERLTGVDSVSQKLDNIYRNMK